MSERTWPLDWFAWRDGAGCPMCAQGRVDEDDGGGASWRASTPVLHVRTHL